LNIGYDGTVCWLLCKGAMPRILSSTANSDANVTFMEFQASIVQANLHLTRSFAYRTACTTNNPVWMAGDRNHLMHSVCLFSGSNVTSVAEDEIMRILILMRNFIPGYKQVSESSCLARNYAVFVST
jgi:hypothetical protein